MTFRACLKGISNSLLTVGLGLWIDIGAWFDFMDAKPAAGRTPICIGGGGEMRAAGRAGQQRAANFYWDKLARRPSCFHLAGKPLLLVDTDKNYGPGDFDDSRFTVRWVGSIIGPSRMPKCTFLTAAGWTTRVLCRAGRR